MSGQAHRHGGRAADRVYRDARRSPRPSGADALLPEETRAVRREAREFAEGVLRPLAHELNCMPERRDSFRHDIFKAIADAGLYAVPFAKDVGGRGFEFPTLATLTVVEELGYYSAGIASALYDAQAILVGKTLERAGGLLRDRYLPRLIRGEFVGSFATSEPGTSTDLSVHSLRTVARPSDGGWMINGHKRWITNSVAADYIVLLCRTGDALSLLFVDMHQPGITVGEPDLKMGNHAQLTADVHFKDAFVPADHVLGSPGSGLRVALGSLALGRMGIGALGVGLAQRAFDVAVDYTAHRTVYGKPIAAFQHWQFKFAEHALEIEAARSLYQKAGQSADLGQDTTALAAMAKIKGSALAVDVARDAIQACGAYGFARVVSGDEEAWPLEAVYRDAKIGEIYEGANEVQKWIIARTIFGREITG
jgi:alkylation response protein AidB-like acyl-CoA dehydrogenase